MALIKKQIAPCHISQKADLFSSDWNEDELLQCGGIKWTTSHAWNDYPLSADTLGFSAESGTSSIFCTPSQPQQSSSLSFFFLFYLPPHSLFFSRLLVLDYVQVSFRITSPLCFALLGASFALLPVCLRISCRLCFALYLCFLLHYLTALFQCIIYRFCLVSFAGSPSRGGDVKIYVCDMNQPSLPTPFYSVLVSI